MSFVRWTFYDPNTLVEFTVPINPNSVSDPDRKKKIKETPTLSKDGTVLLVEGREDAPTMKWSGTILTKAHHDAFIEWYKKSYSVRVTDDNGDEQWVFITGYSSERQRSPKYPYKRTFTMTAYALDGNPVA